MTIETMSETEAAEALGVPRSTLSYWRRSEKLPTGVVQPANPNRPPSLRAPARYDAARIASAASGDQPLFA